MIDNILPLIGRTQPLFEEDLAKREKELNEIVHKSCLAQGLAPIKHSWHPFMTPIKAIFDQAQSSLSI